MRPLLVLLHGWGYDASFWRPLQDRLPEADTLAWDLGYFGTPSMPAPGRAAFAIGHSYGVLWFLRHRPFPWRGLVSINGFSRFAAAEDFPDGVPLTQLDRLRGSVAEATLPALAGFRQRCGDSVPPPPTPDPTRLLATLDNLRDWDARPAQPDLALCGEADKVVPATLSRAAFTPDLIQWHEGGHLLPQQDPEWCAGSIRTWLKRMI
ncbi:MAG TPA: alpha/beta hydrolase [Magnetospirillaceae bacterium]|nr:alpha/beta hydrolase [Magnetospirillaceae bacterium]